MLRRKRSSTTPATELEAAIGRLLVLQPGEVTARADGVKLAPPGAGQGMGERGLTGPSMRSTAGGRLGSDKVGRRGRLGRLGVDAAALVGSRANVIPVSSSTAGEPTGDVLGSGKPPRRPVEASLARFMALRPP